MGAAGSSRFRWRHPGEDSPTGERSLLNKPLWLDRGRFAPWQRQQRKVIPVPLTYRFRTPAHEGVLDRLGLANGDMQSEQHGGEGIGPSVKAQLAQGAEQNRSRED